MLRVTRRTVYNWLRAGKLKGARAGGTWRVDQNAIPCLFHPPADRGR